MGETDTTEPTINSPKIKPYKFLFSPYHRRFYFENASTQFRSSTSSNGTRTILSPTLSCKSTGRWSNDQGAIYLSPDRRRAKAQHDLTPKERGPTETRSGRKAGTD
jgi:hypothetical protein